MPVKKKKKVASDELPPEEMPPAEPPPETSGAPSGIEVAKFGGWTLSVDGRINTFFSYGFGDQKKSVDPVDGLPIPDVGGLTLNENQTKPDGKTFATPRIRNGFVGNVLAFKLTRNLTSTTTLTGYLSLWSDIETNLSVYLFPATYMQEGYLRLEGPWGRLTAGRQMALFSRGAVDINFLYGHGDGMGYPCNFNFIYAGCGMIGFGVMFPFFRSGVLYETPSLGGLTFAAGMYDPVFLAGKWERVITPTFQAEAAYTTKLGRTGLFKIFTSTLWQRLGGASNLQQDAPGMPAMPDTRTIAHKTVDQYGVAGGARLEIGPLRLGVAGHYGKGLGFYYAQENSQAAYYTASDTSDPRDGDLRTFQGFYGQAMLVLGKIDIAAGAGASQLVRLSYDDSHLPKQQLGINTGLFVHISENLVWGLDFFRGQFTWWASGVTQNINVINSGLTMKF